MPILYKRFYCLFSPMDDVSGCGNFDCDKYYLKDAELINQFKKIAVLPDEEKKPGT